MYATAVILAAGRGERFGSGDKVLAPLLQRPVLAWSLDAFQAATTIEQIIVVAGEHTIAAIRQLVATGTWSKVTQIVPGGASRQQSMALGVRAADGRSEVIAVHDGARALVRPDQIDSCVHTAVAHGAAILATSVTDTLKRAIHGKQITETIDRTSLWAAQTPQAFQSELLRKMIVATEQDVVSVTDEASMAEYLGIPVWIVPGDMTNIKITHPHDLAVAEALLAAREGHTS